MMNVSCRLISVEIVMSCRHRPPGAHLEFLNKKYDQLKRGRWNPDPKSWSFGSARLGGNRANYEGRAIAFRRAVAPDVPNMAKRLPSFAGQDRRFMGNLRKQIDGDENDAAHATLKPTSEPQMPGRQEGIQAGSVPAACPFDSHSWATTAGVVTRVLLLVGLVSLGGGCHSITGSMTPLSESRELLTTRTIHVQLPSGSTDIDLYFRAGGSPKPLIVVAHGFFRSKANMSEWGRKLAGEGFVAAVPDLPAWADHARNGRFINDLIENLTHSPPEGLVTDPKRLGLMGFSAGGLATLLAAADNPAVRVWVGLDPVDKDGQGVAAAAKFQCRAAILRAEPSACNANGNAVEIARALKVPCQNILVPKATHADPEWPTDWKAQMVCGAASDDRRAVFVRHALMELKAALLPEPSR